MIILIHLTHQITSQIQELRLILANITNILVVIPLIHIIQHTAMLKV